MAKTETLYLSDDGKKKFKTEIEADGYNLFKQLEPRIEAYVAETNAPKATAGLLRKQLPGFIAFAKNKGDIFELAESVVVETHAETHSDTAAEASAG